MASLFAMTTLLSVARASEVLPGCNTDEDCNLNGHCVPGDGGILPWNVTDGQNAVWGRDINCGGTPGEPGIAALGFVDTPDRCWTLCNQSQAHCFGFAYHHPDHPNKACARGCFGLLDDTWAPVDEERVTSGQGPRAWNGTCSCNPGWTGNTCGRLDLMPMASDAPPAYGTLPTTRSTGLATWGGSIVRDPEDADRWHLYASEISHGCGLDAWGRNSVIIHATASSPMGPYVRKSELLPYFAHEPTVVELPAAVGGGYVLYKIGCADGAVTGSNGTGLVGACTDCSNGTTLPKAHCPGTDQSYERACQDVLHALHPDGPWKRVNLSMPRWDWVNVNLGLESHAPVVFENGTVLTLTRSWGTPPPYPNSALWLIRANSWDGEYSKVPSVPQPFLPVTMEDSFMWRDVSGHFHALFHAWAPIDVGAHAFSRDGLHWALSPTRAYGTIVQTTNGGAVQYSRRERPHLVLDASRSPTHLLSAVGGAPAGTTDVWTLPRDFSFTHVQALRRQDAASP